MKKPGETEVPSHFVVTALLSSGCTLVISIVYVILSSIALALRFQCEFRNPESITGSNYFINVIYRLYILEDSCVHSLQIEELTQADTVFLLVIFTLIVSVCTASAAIALITVVTNKDNMKYTNIAAYIYIGACVSTLVIDLTFGIHFGMDYSHLSEVLDRSSGGMSFNYYTDTARLGALFLMVLSMKGFVYPAVNITLLILLVIYTLDFQEQLRKNEHSIHKVGALNAYEQQRREDSWQQQPDMFLGLPRSQQVNPAFINDDDLTPISPPPRSPMREPSMSDYSNNRFFDRSESWQGRSVQSAPRPFSYLGDGNRPMGVKPPPVPAPDYSPPTARRLKSALKPNYM